MITNSWLDGEICIEKTRIKYKIHSYSIRKPVQGALSTNVHKQVFKMTPVAYIKQVFNMTPVAYITSMNIS